MTRSPLDRLYGVCVVMDARKYVSSPNDTITAEEIKEWERKTGITIPEHGILFIYTGWEEKWGKYESWKEYWEKCGHGWPGLSEDAAEYLVKEKKLIGIGIDTLSIDPPPQLSSSSTTLTYPRASGL